MSQESVEIVRRGIDAYDRGDLDGILATWAPNAVLDWSRSRGFDAGVYRGHREIRAQWRRLLEAPLRLRVVDRSDADRLKLLDRIADRVPELDLAQHSVEWTTLDDGHEALLVAGGGIDGGNGTYFANCGDDVHAVGSVAPLVPGHVGCVVIKPDGSRELARVQPDPLAQNPD